MKKNDQILGVILAGGKSSRFGKDKSLLVVEGKTILERVKSVLSSIFSEVIVVMKDIIPNKGPLGGIYTALLNSNLPYIFVSACDMPFLKDSVIKEIVDKVDNFDIVVPKTKNGLHPLCAVYSKKCTPIIKEAIDKGELKVQGIFSKLNTKVVDIAGEIVNINTPEEYERQVR